MYQRKTDLPKKGLLTETIMKIAEEKGRVDYRDVPETWTRRSVSKMLEKLAGAGRLLVVRHTQVGRYAKPAVYTLPENPYGKLVK